ncbi:ABC transporter ATP-binding protein [Methylophilus sp. 14]|uniref:ABC transporter ATP-binding protein n=1 Tax=Methylophilus sp. 14 TaxID=2781019 RepID=UPI00188F25A3|nr:ABC transporter ATP-binding protein [Methylophilus sp. 14]MBF4988663.1 ABC transporter ATP-binding protein [Methylophilus sp. 14]
MTPLLTVNQLSLQFAGRPILNALNLTVETGQVVSVLGSNGAGKSTLLKSILGLHDGRVTQTGAIHIAGIDLVQARQQALSQLAYVPEQPAVYGHLSAIENIRYFLSLGAVSQTLDITTCLSMAGLPEQAWQRPCSDYSKGMKQKVMLALALAKQARLLLLDEPNSGLDPQATEELNQLILQCKQQGMGVLVVTHDVLSAMAFSDRLLMLANGQLSPVNLDQQALTLDNLKRLYQGQL